jgi:hypothetical protein
MRKELKSFSIFTIIFIAFANPAYAYLDPGTGSAILQGVLGGLAAIAVILKLYWHRLLRFFGLRKDSTKQNDYTNPDTAKDKTR